MKERRKQNNKGFSLVELIVVVAIMGVLMTVLAPNLLRYVERARLQSDNSGIAEIANSIKIVLSDEDVNSAMIYEGENANNTLTFTKDEAGVQTVSFPEKGTPLEMALRELLSSGFSTTSNKYKSGAAMVISVDADGVIKVTNYIADIDGDADEKIF